MSGRKQQLRVTHLAGQEGQNRYVKKEFVFVNLTRMQPSDEFWCPPKIGKVWKRLFFFFLLQQQYTNCLGSEGSIFNECLTQCYWNRRFAIPGFWPNVGAPWKTGFSSFSHQVMSWGRSKFFNSRAPFLSALMTSLDGKNQFSMERAHLPKPGNSKPSISIMLGLVI